MVGPLPALESSTVTEHLRHMIEKRSGVSEIPDAFFFFPEQLGGLGLRNPFVSTLLVRDELRSTPVQLINDYKENDKKAYLDAKKRFEELTERERLHRYQQVYPDAESGANPVLDRSDLSTLMSFEEYIRFRESTYTLLAGLYEKLMDFPEEIDIELTEEVDKRFLPVGVLTMLKGKRITWQMVL